MTTKLKRGRPRAWETPKDLEREIDSYFEEVDEQKTMPTKAGLTLHLGVVKDTLSNYQRREVKENATEEEKEIAKEYGQFIDKAYAVIENAWTQRLAGSVPTGSIFYLKAAFHYKDRFDVTSDEKPLEGNKIVFENFQKVEKPE